MSQAPAGPEPLAEVAAGSLLRVRWAPLGLGLATFLSLVLGHALFEVVAAGLSGEDRSGLGVLGYATATIVALLIGFLVGARMALARATERDLAVLRARLRGFRQEDEPASDATRLGALAGVLAPLAAVPVGLLVIPDPGSGAPYLLSEAPWARAFVWALFLNALLFAVMGRLVFETFTQLRLVGRLGAGLEIDLLDPGPLRIVARPGLRSAAVWFAGSALASLIFLNVSYHWATGAVILATLLVGALAFLLPTRGVHRRLAAAKRSELVRVREALRGERGRVLEGAGAGGRLPALLAYEARIERVREWPFDVPTLLRFLALALVAAGSWLGGALVERVLGLFLD